LLLSPLCCRRVNRPPSRSIPRSPWLSTSISSGSYPQQ
jgi:hypothetical protein